MDTNFAVDVLDGVGGSDSHDAAAPQHLGDPMDLDVDFDVFSWAVDFDSSTSRPEQDLGVGYDASSKRPPTAFLFADDESVLPATLFEAQPSHALGDAQLIQATQALPLPEISGLRPYPGSFDARQEDAPCDNGLAHERLRRQLSLLSKGWCGDEIRFKNCDPYKAVVLHNLAMELGLGYNHDVRTQEVSMSRLEPPRPASSTQPAPGRLSSLFSRSSTELDSTRCLPGLPAFPPLRVPEFPTPFTDIPPQQVAAQKQASQSTSATKGQALLSRHPSRSERISDSISKHVSTFKTSISKGGRRGPLTENGRRDMRALEAVGGACWRCKVLRRKCDPGSPACRCCLQSVPMPHLGEDAPLWPLIGCRRGPLRDSIPAQLLCPQSNRRNGAGTGDPSSLPRRCRSVDAADECLLSAESQRLADMKAVFEGASDKLSISDAALRDSFVAFIEAGRYRDHEPLHSSDTVAAGTASYTELIARIAWELAENQSLLPLLEIRSWDSFMNMLETACIYESEVGQTSLVILSMICFQHCLEALRLYSSDLLVPGAHDECSGGQCQVKCIQSLSAQVATYIDELSSVMFNKENMRDRRWWLSTFYSLYIQSYVRHALITIEKQLRFRSMDDVPAEDLTATQYLHLPAVLFTAASAKYDPLLGGRLQYALTENSVIPETSVPELHHSSARVACEVDKWPEAGIRTSYQFLRRMLQIGSLDFFDSSPDASGSPAAFGTPFFNQGRVTSPRSLSPVSGSERILSPRFYQSHRKKDSIHSQSSGQTSFVFSSHNPSLDSLARTMSTDISSLYEPSIFAGAGFFDSVTDLNAAVSPNPIRPTVETSGTIRAPRRLPRRSFDQSMTEGPANGEEAMPDADTAFVCNCCPRAPRRFHTSEELTQHESEKPHACTQCPKRFKSPTEAERHINAIHLKSDSWSCKALENPLLAFQSEIFNGTVWDVCGFCGGGFARKGSASVSRPGGGAGAGAGDDVTGGEGGERERHEFDEDSHRAELLLHLESVHKVGECDRNKKFYRGDNFRQHLKNTHVAKPGKWLKALERVCRASSDVSS
ncbi:hypothetical protein VTK26DRAFT_7009 [Humicola hyalothermophila]